MTLGRMRKPVYPAVGTCYRARNVNPRKEHQTCPPAGGRSAGARRPVSYGPPLSGRNLILACAAGAAKRHVPLAHVEAGLQSFDRRMPEEVNRVLTDRLTDYLFVTEQSEVENLRAEGIPEDRIRLVGNVMIDSLVRFRERATALDPLGKLDLAPDSYVLVTMHRPSNVDTREALLRRLPALERMAGARPVVFPCHVRTHERLIACWNRSATSSSSASWRRPGSWSPTPAAFRRRRPSSASPA